MNAEIDFCKTGARIRSLRKERALTQEELALACGCTTNHLSAIENGSNKPSLSLMLRIAVALDSSIDYFLMDSPRANPKYLINSRIAPKLDACSVRDLQYIERVIDELLSYKEAILAEK